MSYRYGIRWSEELIESELLKIINDMGRMPSANELRLKGMNPLAIKIGRSGGYQYWAKRLNVDQKGTETHRGIEIQDNVKIYLESKGYKVENMSTKYPFDLLINNKCRVDVKSARCSVYGRDKEKHVGHIFGLSKSNPTCDIYLLCPVDGEDNILSRYYVPALEAKIVTLTLTLKGRCKYDIYKEKIDELDKF